MSFTFCVFVMHILNFEMYYTTKSIMFTIIFYNMTDRTKWIFRKSMGVNKYFI